MLSFPAERPILLARATVLVNRRNMVMESTAVLEVACRFGKGAYIIRTISDGAGEDSHLSYSEMVSIVALNSALCVENLLRIMS
jgi:nucleoside phosphorylase